MLRFTPSRRVVLLVLLLAVTGLGIGTYFVWSRRGLLPARGSPLYQKYQRAFQVGVAALDAGREDLAEKNLDRAIELIPGEPAAWANRGLLNLRKNNLEQAAKDLQKARDLAPDSADFVALLGLLAEKQGRLADAVAHLRKAVQEHPHDLASLYALAEAVSKEGGPDHEIEYQRLLEQILKIQPNNLPALVLLAGAAERSKDQAVLSGALERLARLAPGWSPLSRKTFDEVRKAATDAPRDLAVLLPILDNVLKAERGYARDGRAIRPRPGVIGSPLQHFLRLEPTRATPAPPDRELAFSLGPQPILSKDPSRWHVVRTVWLISDEKRAALVEDATRGGLDVRPGDGFTPALFVANSQEVRRADAAEPVLPFPAGPRAVQPTVAGLLPIDWDNDLRTDLVLAGAGGLRFWQQRADGSFADVTDKTKLPADILGGDYHGAWAADIEMDGDLDIIAARRSAAPLLLRNNRDGTFKPVELFPTVTSARAFAWADLDSDGAPDAIFLDAAGKLHIFANDRSGQFSPWPTHENLGTYLAVTAADLDGDGVMNLVALQTDGTLVRISSQERRPSWEVVKLAHWPGVTDVPTGAVNLFVEDLDNNGALDVIVADPRSARIYLANEEGKHAPLPEQVGLRVTAVVDLDRDGRLDLLGIAEDGQFVRALNQSRKGYHWQTIWPLANPKAGDDRINSFAIGGEVEIRAGALMQKQVIQAAVVHFGLGEQSAADVARIVWPHGASQWEFDLPSDCLITAAQRLSGSCPFLFTYDGKGMQFVGDFMWGTPLGMYVNGQNIGAFPQTTEWLKIPGDKLVPRHGCYDIRVHANLWETDFFDQLALIVVDHPPGTDIVVDERFFLTPTAPHYHVTTPARPVAQAWDHEGKDVTDLVQAIDGRYLDHCGRGRFQGVTRDHWVEVDLGDDVEVGEKGRKRARETEPFLSTHSSRPLYLVARGWLHPTNSSINVALAQGNHDMPRPLSLEVPDGKGGWKMVQPALGFPAGKNKTMMIRLDGIAGPGVCRRFRLRTNMEIYWDFLGYAHELDPGFARQHRPTTLAAELRFRGILQMTQIDRSSPEVPHYDKVIGGAQAWRDLTGYCTRFGDVGELLAKVDDRYVIMNAGDEIALRFAVPEGPPLGWRRDFIWECDGWTRDGDLNTRFGNTVLPLPAHGRVGERRPGSLEDDPVYRRFLQDWRTYHTRYVTADEFSQGLWAFRRKNVATR